MQFHELKKSSYERNKKRVGRGRSSGKGKTSGRGTKGQKSRSGHKKLPAFFEGGRMPLVQRLPKKRGFKKSSKIRWEIVNIEKLNVFKSNSEVDKKLLFENKLIKSKDNLVKILGNGGLSKKLSIRADAFSAQALEKIKKAESKAIINNDKKSKIEVKKTEKDNK